MQKVLIILSLIFVFWGSSCDRAEAKIEVETERFDLQKLSPEGQKAYELLLKAERFEQGAVGFAGTVSPYVQSFNEILKEKSADEAFKSLLANATIAGKLYALCGIYFTDQESFERETAKYAQSGESVSTMSGCVIFNRKVAEIVELKTEKVVIIKPSQTIEDFWKTNNGAGYELDIAHGGFPATFRRFAKMKK